jgi:hypothetical protein
MRHEKEAPRMPEKSSDVKHYEALKDKAMSKERAAKITNSPKASHNGGEAAGSGDDARQGGTIAPHKAAGRKGRLARAMKS